MDDQKIDLLSKLFTIKGTPFRPYAPFYPLFEDTQPVNMVFKTGRQISKTTSGVIRHLLHCAIRPNTTVLMVLPLESQAFRISSLFLRPLWENSALSKIISRKIDQSLHFGLENNSNILLSYAHLDPERTRGTPGDILHVDECQDVNSKFLPVLNAAISASPIRFTLYTGTPKTLNNTLQSLWNESSQAEWIIKCEACNHYNIPSTEFDIDKMIGPYREDISMDNPATVCAKCSKVIHPRNGEWVHRYPERRFFMAGYHVPQIIIPLHYADKINWSLLLAFREGRFQMTPEIFCREILGEASDIALKLVSLSDLLSVATLPPKDDLAEITKRIKSYSIRVLGIDWGGGGEEGNFTTLSLVCMAPEGILHVPWGIALRTPHDHIKEAREILHFINLFEPHLIAHDYSGAGALRETILVHSGVDPAKIMPMRYVPGNENVACRFVSPTPWHPRPCYHIEPTRCLLTVIGAIKTKRIRFFKDDYVNEANPGLLRHFLSLIEEESRSVYGRFYISNEPGQPDEFAQATMLGSVAIWYQTKQWPRFTFTEKYLSDKT